MSAKLSRRDAARVLGVATTADDRSVKRAYRRLAREHHPDRGGDPDTFHRLHDAYERLVGADDAPAAPTMSRGRPSRPPAPHTSEHDLADVASVAWEVAVHGAEPRLDRDRLAILLAAPGPRTVTPVTATSRAPGSRLNPVAAKLSPALTARLTIRATTDDRGADLVAAELVASSRRARRAVDRIDLNGTWTRTRRSSSTSLRTTLTPSADRQVTAVRVVDRVARLLADLRWPLDGWTATAEGP